MSHSRHHQREYVKESALGFFQKIIKQHEFHIRFAPCPDFFDKRIQMVFITVRKQDPYTLDHGLTFHELQAEECFEFIKIKIKIQGLIYQPIKQEEQLFLTVKVSSG